MKAKTSITLSTDVLKGVDRLAGPRDRDPRSSSASCEETCESGAEPRNMPRICIYWIWPRTDWTAKRKTRLNTRLRSIRDRGSPNWPSISGASLP